MTTLSAVKRYMEGHRRASVDDLAVGLSTTPDTARSLLEMWRAKERVRFIPGACGSCGRGVLGGCSCPMAAFSADLYEWLGEEGHAGAGPDVATARSNDPSREPPDLAPFLGLRRFVSIAHHVPGRIRLKLDARALAHLPQVDPKPFGELLSRIRGVRATRVNPAALSVVVEYDQALIAPPLFAQLLTDEPAAVERILAAHLS